MADNTLGLLFEISADPSKAEQALEQLRSSYSSTLGQMSAAQQSFDRQLSSQAPLMEASTQAVTRAFQAQTMLTEAQQKALPAIRAQAAEFHNLASTALVAFDQMAGAVRGWGGVTLRVMGQVANQIFEHMRLQQLEAANTAKTEAQKTLVSIHAIKQLAIVKAVEMAAKGFEALAGFDFWQAAQYFASAALYGSIGAMQIMAIAGSAGGGGRRRRRVSGNALRWHAGGDEPRGVQSDRSHERGGDPAGQVPDCDARPPGHDC